MLLLADGFSSFPVVMVIEEKLWCRSLCGKPRTWCLRRWGTRIEFFLFIIFLIYYFFVSLVFIISIIIIVFSGCCCGKINNNTKNGDATTRFKVCEE